MPSTARTRLAAKIRSCRFWIGQRERALALGKPKPDGTIPWGGVVWGSAESIRASLVSERKRLAHMESKLDRLPAPWEGGSDD